MSHKRSMNVPQAAENAIKGTHAHISGTKGGAPPGSVGSNRALTLLAISSTAVEAKSRWDSLYALDC